VKDISVFFSGSSHIPVFRAVAQHHHLGVEPSAKIVGQRGFLRDFCVVFLMTSQSAAILSVGGRLQFPSAALRPIFY
jgi:hypothetical protein